MKGCYKLDREDFERLEELQKTNRDELSREDYGELRELEGKLSQQYGEECPEERMKRWTNYENHLKTMVAFDYLEKDNARLRNAVKILSIVCGWFFLWNIIYGIVQLLKVLWQ